MAAIITDANGLDSGLVVLRDIVSLGFGQNPGHSLRGKGRRPTSDTGILRVVSKNLSDLLEENLGDFLDD